MGDVYEWMCDHTDFRSSPISSVSGMIEPTLLRSLGWSRSGDVTASVGHPAPPTRSRSPSVQGRPDHQVEHTVSRQVLELVPGGGDRQAAVTGDKTRRMGSRTCDQELDDGPSYRVDAVEGHLGEESPHFVVGSPDDNEAGVELTESAIGRGERSWLGTISISLLYP